MTPLHVTLQYSRGTKTLGRYIEGTLKVTETGKEEVFVEQPLIGVLYVRKERLGDKPPKVLTVTITGGEDATD